MSVLFAEGFDGIGADLNYQAVAGQLGYRGLNFSLSEDTFITTEVNALGGNNLVAYSSSWIFPVNSAQPILGMRVKTAGITPVFSMMITDSEGKIARFKFKDSAGSAIVTHPSIADQNLVTGVQAGVFNYIEFGLVNNKLILRINNVEMMNVALTMTGSTNVAIDFSQDYAYLDDMYVADDGQFRGDCFIRTVPTSLYINDGVVIGGTAEAALQSFDGDASYIQLAGNGSKCGLKIASLPDEIVNIHAVAVTASRSKSTAGATTSKLSLNVNGTDYTQNTQAPPLVYGGQRAAKSVNPATNSPWTRASVLTAAGVVEMVS